MAGWHHQLNAHKFSNLWETVKDRETCHATVLRVSKSRTQLSD